MLAYIVEVLRLLTLDATLPAEINERSRKALKHERIAKWHGLRAVADIIRVREADEGTRCAVRAYQADLIVLSIQFSKNRVPSLFTRTADALVRRLSREMIIDSVLVG